MSRLDRVSPYQKRRTRRIRQPYRRPFTLHNIMHTPNRPASYALFSPRRKIIYVGSAGKDKGEKKRGVRDRLIDHWYERGDHLTVPGKDKLSEEAAYFDVQFGKSVYENREAERDLKRQVRPRFNIR